MGWLASAARGYNSLHHPTGFGNRHPLAANRELVRELIGFVHYRM